MKGMVVSVTVFLLSSFLNGHLQAAPTLGDSEDQQREAVQEQIDRLTLQQIERTARWVDEMPGALPEEQKEKKPASRAAPDSKRKAQEKAEAEKLIRDAGARFRVDVQNLEPTARRPRSSSHSSETEQFAEGDELEEYVLEMPAGNGASSHKKKVRLKVKRGVLDARRKIDQLNKMLIDDVVRMTGPPLKLPRDQ